MLRAVALHGTVTAAAESLHLSASAVSQQLTSLEREVGQPITEQHGRRIRLTAAGLVLAKHAGRLATLLEEAEADLVAASMGRVGEIQVAAFSSAVVEVVAPAIVALRRSAPEVRIRVTDAEGPTAQRLLAEGQVDVAIAVAHQDRALAGVEDFHREPLYEEPFDALVPSEDPLATSGFISLDQLAGHAWITPLPGNPIRDLTLFACDEAGFRPSIDSVSNDFRTVCALVAAGSGVALAPRSALSRQRIRGVAVVPLKGKAPSRRVFVSVRSGASRHPLINEVVRELRNQARNVDRREPADDVSKSRGSVSRGQP